MNQINLLEKTTSHLFKDMNMKFNVFKKCLNVLQSDNGVFPQEVTIDTYRYKILL